MISQLISQKRLANPVRLPKGYDLAQSRIGGFSLCVFFGGKTCGESIKGAIFSIKRLALEKRPAKPLGTRYPPDKTKKTAFCFRRNRPIFSLLRHQFKRAWRGFYRVIGNKWPKRYVLTMSSLVTNGRKGTF